MSNKPQLYRPGISGNPAGRPKGSLNQKTILEEAIMQYETETGQSLMRRFIEMAFKNPRVMIALINKLIPNARPEAIEPPPPQKIIFEIVDTRKITEEKQKEQPEIIKPKAIAEKTEGNPRA